MFDKNGTKREERAIIQGTGSHVFYTNTTELVTGPSLFNAITPLLYHGNK